MIDFSLVVIRTDKQEAQAAFYTMLGFQFDHHRHGNGPLHYASVNSKVVLEIYPLTKSISTSDNSTRLGFTVPALDELITRLKDNGINILSTPSQTEWGTLTLSRTTTAAKLN